MSKIIFMGTPDFSTKVLEMLIAEHNVIAVVTQPDRPVGRKRKLTPPPVKRKLLYNMVSQCINQKNYQTLKIYKL